MRQVKAILLALAAVFAIGVFGANGAYAGSGIGSIELELPFGSSSCDFELEHESWAPELVGDPYYEADPDNGYKAEFTSLIPDAGNCDLADLEILSECPLWVHKSKSNHPDPVQSSKATLEGCIRFKVMLFPGIYMSCTYLAQAPGLTGTWWWGDPPVNSRKSFDLHGSIAKLPPSNFICPNSLGGVRFWMDLDYPA